MKLREAKINRSSHWVMAMLLAGLLLPLDTAASLDNWNVDGEHGELAIHGMLLEGACHLDMSSAWQIVEMGDISTAPLLHPGDEGAPLTFKVILRDCIHMQGDEVDQRTNRHVWDPKLPVISLSFGTPYRHGGNELIDVPGMPGMGLRISDVKHNGVEQGFSDEPHVVNAGDNELQFTVTPVRTLEPLIPGPFQASVDFQLEYD